MDLELVFYYFIVEGFELDLYIRESLSLVMVVGGLRKHRIGQVLQIFEGNGCLRVLVHVWFFVLHPYCCFYLLEISSKFCCKGI